MHGMLSAAVLKALMNYDSYYYIRLTAFLQDNPGKPAPER